VDAEVREILRRSRKPTPTWKKVSALAYGILLLALIAFVISDELWTELRIPLKFNPTMEKVKWARVDPAVGEEISVDENTGLITVGSEEALKSLLPSTGEMLLTWTLAVVVILAAGSGIGLLVLKLGYFADRAKIATLLFFTIFGLTMIIPFFWMVSNAFKSLQETRLNELDWIPWPVRYTNFYEAIYLGAVENAPEIESQGLSRLAYAAAYLSEMLRGQNFVRFYANSFFIASYVTVGLIFTSSLAAYSFARLNFPGRDKLFLAYLATMMIPGAVTSIPVFVLMCKIGWVDSYKAIIFPAIFSAYGTFMLRQFFMTLPGELEDAAKIDGCSLFGIFLRIILPLSKPALATLTIFTFMGQWRNFMWPLIILNDPKKMPLPVGLQFFAASAAPDPNVLMAATMMMIIPIIIVFIIGQRYFVEGIQLGAVKG